MTLKLFDASLTSNIVVGYSFDIKKNIWRVWTMADHPFHSMAGHFFKKCSKFCQKMPKKSLLGYTSWETMLFRVGATQKKNNTNFFYMLILTACNRVTCRNDFRPLEGSGALQCGVCRTSKNRIFIWVYRLFFSVFMYDLFGPYLEKWTIFSWILNYCRVINFYRRETFTIWKIIYFWWRTQW